MHRRATIAVVACALVVACLVLRSIPIANAALIAIAGAVLAWSLGVRLGGVPLGAIALASHVLVVVLAVGLYAVSAYGLPVLTDVQLGGGFLTIGPDAVNYHGHAMKIIDAWRDGTAWPLPHNTEFFTLTALVYLAVGAHPLNAIFLNALCHSLVVLTIFHLGQRLFDLRVARTAALLTAFWPSLLVWSAQLLKDPLLLLLSVLLVGAAAIALDPAPPRRAGPVIVGGVVCFALALVTFKFRPYVVVLVLLALAVATTLTAPWPTLGEGGRRLRRGLALVVVMAAAVAAGMALDFERLVAPAHPEAGYARRGLERVRAGDQGGALAEYTRALAHSPRYSPALRGAGLSALALGRRDEALQHLDAYLHAVDDAEVRALIATTHGGQSAADAAATALRLSAQPALAPSNPSRPAEDGGGVGQAPRPGTAIRGTVRRLLTDPIAELDAIRHASLRGAGTVLDPDVRFRSPRDVAVFIPRALALSILSPLPSHWFHAAGSTGVFKMLAGCEAIVTYFLLPVLALGAVVGMRGPHRGVHLVLVYGVLSAIALGIVVANLGTLFRLRLTFVIPWLLVTAAGAEWLRARLVSAWFRGPAIAPSPERAEPAGTAPAPGPGR